MTRKNFIPCLISILFVSPFFAQESNIFLNRDYWKSNPSIADIDKKISEGHDIAELNPFAFDAVTWALIEKADNETVKYLLSKEGNGVNKLTHDGRTYIFWAAYKDNIEMMQYLVDRGAKTNIVDSHGYSLLNFAAVTGQQNTKLYDFIFDHGADIQSEKNHDGANALLLVAPFLRNFELVNYFLSKGIGINSIDNYGNGMFNYAAKGGHIEFLKTLIKKGLPYQELNNKGGNAFIMASQGTRGKPNTLEVYKFLESQGLSANVIGKDSKNPLHFLAYSNKDTDIFSFFITKGLDVNQKDTDGNTPFLNAANSNSLEMVKNLANEVTDFNLKNNKGQSALTRAVNRNSTEVVAYLIENGSNVNVKDTEGNTLAYYLMDTYRPNNSKTFEDKLKLLSANGLDMSQIQGKGNTLYHIAIEKNNLELVKRMSTFNIDVNAKNNDGLTPLHIAAMKAKDSVILDYLLSIGADKTVKTDFEESVYDLASENELLKQHRIDISFLK